MSGKITFTQDLIVMRDGWTIGWARKIMRGPFYATIGDREIGPAKTKTDLARMIRTST